MKTLKKVLSVALVLAMAFSLVTLAGAAGVSKYQDFTDAADIENVEAVDTLVGLGIINGMDDGSYSPEGYFTRAQAAKIMTYMLLGESIASTLKAAGAPFADVPATHWAAPYIQYCAGKGIINGVGDNKFDPDGYVTAAQFAKMLLVAAGYGKQGEFVGDDWLLNTIILAQNVGILDTGVDYNAPATRDEVARYAFNFYTKVAFVSFSKDTEEYKERVTVVREGDADVTYKLTLAYQQGVMPINSAVIGGVQHHQWYKNAEALTGNNFASNFRVLAKYTDGTSFYDATNPGRYFKAALADSYKFYLNGEEMDTAAELAEVDALIGCDENESGTKGVIVQLIDTTGDKKAEIVVITEKMVGVLTADAYLSRDGKKVNVPGILPSSTSVENVVGYEGLKANDVVLYYTEGGVTYIEKAKAVAGKLTSVRGGTLTFAGAQYTLSELSGTVLLSEILDENNFDIDATVYLDDGGYVVKFVPAPAGSPTVTYLQGVLVGYQYDTFNGTAVAKLVKEDGVVAIYSVAASNGVVPNQQADFAGVLTERIAKYGTTDEDESGLPYGYLVNYVVGDDGKVSLVPLTSGELVGDYGDKGTVATIEYTKKVSGSDTKVSEKFYFNSGTKVFYFDATAPYSSSNKVTVVTGYANTVGMGDTTPVFFVARANNALTALMFCDAGTFTTTATKYAFVLSADSEVIVRNGKLAYVYTGYVNGEVVDIVSEEDDLFDSYKFGLPKYFAITEEDGLVDSTGIKDTDNYIKTVNAKTIVVDEGYIAVQGVEQPIKINADTKFYQYDATDTEEPIKDADSIGASYGPIEYTILQYLEVNGFATEIYFTYDVK